MLPNHNNYAMKMCEYLFCNIRSIHFILQKKSEIYPNLLHLIQHNINNPSAPPINTVCRMSDVHKSPQLYGFSGAVHLLYPLS